LSLRRVDSMAYADMDWQALEGILDEDTAVIAKDDDQSTAEEPTEPAPEA